MATSKHATRSAANTLLNRFRTSKAGKDQVRLQNQKSRWQLLNEHARSKVRDIATSPVATSRKRGSKSGAGGADKADAGESKSKKNTVSRSAPVFLAHLGPATLKDREQTRKWAVAKGIIDSETAGVTATIRGLEDPNAFENSVGHVTMIGDSHLPLEVRAPTVVSNLQVPDGQELKTVTGASGHKLPGAGTAQTEGGSSMDGKSTVVRSSGICKQGSVSAVGDVSVLHDAWSTQDFEDMIAAGVAAHGHRWFGSDDSNSDSDDSLASSLGSDAENAVKVPQQDKQPIEQQQASLLDLKPFKKQLGQQETPRTREVTIARKIKRSAAKTPAGPPPGMSLERWHQRRAASAGLDIAESTRNQVRRPHYN